MNVSFFTHIASLRRPRGFTLIELLIVITIIAVLSTLAVPAFFTAFQRMRFTNLTIDIQNLFAAARTQALASKFSIENGTTPRIPPGGYGVVINPTTKTATLFIDDWNVAAGKAVNLDYNPAALSQRAAPDAIYTPSKDTKLSEIDFSAMKYVAIDTIVGVPLASTTSFASTPDAVVTVIYRPPYSDTSIAALRAGTTTALTQVAVAFRMPGSTPPLTRTLTVNRITTAPLISR